MVITNALIVDHTGIYKADIGIKDGRIAGIGKAGNPDVMAGRDARDGGGGDHRGHRRRGADPHRGRHRQPHPLHLPAAGRRGAGQRHHLVDRRRHRPGHRHQRHHLHARAPGTSRGCWRPWTTSRSTSASPARATPRGPEGLVEQIRAGAVGLKLHEDWGTTPADHRLLPRASPRARTSRSPSTPTRSNESGFVDDSIAAFKGRTIHTYHSEGAGGGHAPDIIRVCGVPHVLPSLHQPHPPVHGEHARRASGHAHGLPPPRPRDPRGRGLRREPHPRRDHRRRGHPPRPRGDQHDVQRQPGDGPGGRGDHPHLADRAQDARAARPAPRGARATTTTSASAATSRSTPSTRPSPTASPTRRARSRWGSWRISCSGSRASSG